MEKQKKTNGKIKGNETTNSYLIPFSALVTANMIIKYIRHIHSYVYLLCSFIRISCQYIFIYTTHELIIFRFSKRLLHVVALRLSLSVTSHQQLSVLFFPAGWNPPEDVIGVNTYPVHGSGLPLIYCTWNCTFFSIFFSSHKPRSSQRVPLGWTIRVATSLKPRWLWKLPKLFMAFCSTLYLPLSLL